MVMEHHPQYHGVQGPRPPPPPEVPPAGPAVAAGRALTSDGQLFVELAVHLLVPLEAPHLVHGLAHHGDRQHEHLQGQGDTTSFHPFTFTLFLDAPDTGGTWSDRGVVVGDGLTGFGSNVVCLLIVCYTSFSRGISNKLIEKLITFNMIKFKCSNVSILRKYVFMIANRTYYQ